MNNKYNVQNSMLGGQKIPPPATEYNAESIVSYGTLLHALLHQVYASCGRVFLFMLFALPFFAASCSQDNADITPLAPMRQMYDESANLTKATVDSISGFCVKFSGYVNQHPQSKQDDYFEPIIQNVRTAAALHGYDIKVSTVTSGIKINDEWEDEIVINFD